MGGSYGINALNVPNIHFAQEEHTLIGNASVPFGRR